MINKLYNEDCFKTMNDMYLRRIKVNAVLTSPPYNTGRLSQTQKSMDNHNTRYDIYVDSKTDVEYLDWSVELFNQYEKILKQDGVILYNVSYSAENNPNLMWLFVSDIIRRTDFMVADCIIWKKGSALPNNVSKNKLTRITEFVFVFCRKSEYKTFNTNKKVKSVSKTGQKYYENIFNFFEAKNNDGSNKLNKATYSSDFCKKLIDIYLKEGDLVYDSFMGTGTTAKACIDNGLNFIGSELSEAQCKYAEERIKPFMKEVEVVKNIIVEHKEETVVIKSNNNVLNSLGTPPKPTTPNLNNTSEVEGEK